MKMEAVPRLYMLSCDLKISPTNADFSTPLKKYIRDFYHESPESYDKEIKEIEALRQIMCKVPHDFTGCSHLKRYFSQLTLLQNRFPMTDDGPACVPFTWSDIYSGATVSITDIKYEQACVLYNIGALHSELGALDTRNNVEGMKMACTHFQCAAWAFQHLRDTYPQPKGSDMSHDILTYMMNIMLAQAQECILEKSMLDNRKSSITAKVAAQVVDYYRCALGILVSNNSNNSSISDTVGSKIYKGWKKYIEFKMAYYTSISHFFMGNHSEEEQKMGERVAWFQSATEHLNEAVKVSKNMDKEHLNESLTFLMDVIVGKFNSAKKENDFVYHEKVPPINVLPELKGASLVKGIPFNPMDPDVCGADIFARLVPMETHSYSSMYSEEKAKILRTVLARIEGKDEELSTYMSSLQLDRSIFKDESEGIPQELLEKCAALSVRPTAVSDLTELMTDLAETSNNVETNLKLCSELLSEEEVKEAKHQELFGKRVPSMITVELKKERSKLEEAHKKASESNKTLQNAASAHIDNLQVLAGPIEDLKKKLPSMENVKSSENDQAMQNLIKLLNKVDEMQEQRLTLAQQLREALHGDDITKRLVALDNKAEVENVFQEELKKHDQCLTYIDQNLSAQDNILFALTQANAEFADVRKTIVTERNNREIMVNSLIASYGAYEDLVEKGKKGLEFYQKLKSSVSKLLDRIRSVTRVQDEERAQRAGADRRASLPEMPSSIQVCAQPPTLKQYLPYFTNSKMPLPSHAKNLPTSTVASYLPSSRTPTGYIPTVANQPKMSGDQHLPSQHLPVSKPHLHHSPVAQPTYNAYGSLPSRDTSQAVAGVQQYKDDQSSFYETDKKSFVHDLRYSGVNTVDGSSKPMYAPFFHAGQIVSYPDASASLSAVPGSQMQPYSQTNATLPTPSNVAAHGSQILSYPQANATSLSTVPGSQMQSYSQTNATLPSPSNVVTPRSQVQSYPSMSTALPAASNISHSSLPFQPTYTSVPAFIQNNESTYYPSDSHRYLSSNVLASNMYNIPTATTVYQQNYGETSNNVPTNANSGRTCETYSSGTCIPHPGIAATNQYPYSNSSAVKYPTANKDLGSMSSYYSYETTYLNESKNLVNSYNSGSYNVSNTVPTANQYSYPIHTSMNYSSVSVPYSNTSAVPPVQNNSVLPYSTCGTSFSNTYSYSSSFPAASQAVTVVNGVYYPQSSIASSGKPQYVVEPNAYANLPSVYANTTSTNPSQISAHTPQVDSYNTVQSYPGVNQMNQFPNQQATSVLETAPLISQEPLQPQTSDVGKEVKPLEPKCDTPSNASENSPQMTKLNNVENNAVTENSHVTPEKSPINHNDTNKESDLKSQHSKDFVKLNICKPKPAESPESKDPLSDPSVQMKFISEVEKYEKLVDGLVRKSLNGTTPLDQKWKELTDAQEKESRKMSISVARCYPLKNRVPDIMPYDSNRVKMVSSKDDYINASYLKDLLPSSPIFVITQAPLPSTFSDFWLMVWEQQVETLVCLLPPNELKNHVYWPKERGVPITHGLFDLSLQSLKESDCFAERIISINHNKNKTSRVVVQLQFKLWYSSKVPELPDFLQFVSMVLNYHSQQRSLLRPLVVHCSSGVGRSGAFCLITAVISEMTLGHGPRDVSSVAMRMCTQRKYFIQDKGQFKFCYDAVLSYARNCLKKKGLLPRKHSFDDKAASLVHFISESESDMAKLQSSMINLGISTDPKYFIQPASDSSSNKTSSSTSSTCDGRAAELRKPTLEEEIKNADNTENLDQNCSVSSTELEKPETPVSTVSSILDPNNFTLDSQSMPSKRRITKDTFIQSTGVLSRSNADSSDPLSNLDPLWSLKK